MPTVAHSALTGAELHEPKGIAGAASNRVYVSTGAGTGAWQKLNESDNFDFSVKAKNLFGWNDIADSQYTSGAPRSIASGVRTQITNNGLGAQTDTTRLGSVWNTASNKFLVNDLNAFYIVRFNAKIKAVAAAGTPYIVTFETETSNGPTVINGNTQFIKGGSAVNSVSWTSAVYIGSFINDTDITLHATPDTDITMYDVGFVIQRTYKES